MSQAPDAAAVEAVIGHLERGDAGGAEAVAGRSRAMFPGSVELARLHGVALLMLGRPTDARKVFEVALGLAPSNTDVQSNLASALLAEGHPAQAVAVLERATAARPGDARLRNNFANALHAAGENERARDEYVAALAIAPEHIGATINLAAIEMALGRTADAEARLRAVLARQPHPQAWLLLGHVLHRERRYAEAQAAYERGAQLVPDAAEFPYHAGLMADEQAHYAEAASLYRRALQLDPSLQVAEGQLLFVLRRVYDWTAAEPLAARLRARAAAGADDIDPFAFLAEDTTPAEQLACARARAARVMREVQPFAGNRPSTYAPRANGAALRVGFVSAGFGARGGVPHATALLTVAMFEALGKRDTIELHLFATTPDAGSPIRQRLQGAAHEFHDVAGEPVPSVAERIRAAKIDVLVDVDGWCAGGLPGVFALRPAPVQASWLAYPGTSGAPFIDWLIADRFVVPESLERSYSEKIACLPRCYQPSDPTRVVGAPPLRSSFGLPDDAVVFASFNNAWKLNAASFARMCAVLRGVPGSVLWLLDAGRDADARLRDAARAHAIDPARLVFSPSLPHLEHLARYPLADLFLDTNPYNAHTTASDAIWAGCPVLTRPGDTFASRVAGSLDHYLGMAELIAPDDATFIATAVRLGNDRAALAALRERLAQQRETSGLFDMQAYARDFAALLHAMDQRHCLGLSQKTAAQPKLR